MANLTHPQVVRVAYKHLHWGQAVVNTIHWYSGVALTQNRVDEFASVAQTYYVDAMPSMWTHQFAYRGMSVRQRVVASPMGADLAILGGVDGTITVNGNRPAEAVALKLKSSSFGKSGSGTFFGGGMPDNVVIAGLIDDNYRTNYATALNNYFLAVKADLVTWYPVVFSQVSGGATRPSVVLYPVIDVDSVTLHPAHMSSRNPGSGT